MPDLTSVSLVAWSPCSRDEGDWYFGVLVREVRLGEGKGSNWVWCLLNED